jgi:hypothetical protein
MSDRRPARTDRASRPTVRDWLWLIPKSVLWSLPFTALFGTIYRRFKVGLGGYVGAFYVSMVFAFTIMTLVFVNERFVVPTLFPVTPRLGTPRFWLMIGTYIFVSLVGTAIAAVIVHFTLVPGFLGSSRQIVINVIVSLFFTLLITGIIMAIGFYRGALANVRSEQELNLARRIQTSFLPSEFPRLPQLDIHAINVSSREVSGDFYDVVEDGEGGWLIAIADVAGKGVPAALLSSMLQASLRTQAPARTRVSEILQTINGVTYRSTAVHQFATFFLAHVDPRTMKLSFTNAGHNHPYLLREGDEPLALVRGGTVVGILEAVRYEEDAVILRPGDRIVFYTDGISEATNARGDMYGEERIIAAANAIPPDASARAMTEGLLQSVRAFLDGIEAGDDMTVMVVRVLDAPVAATPAPTAEPAASSTA